MAIKSFRTGLLEPLATAITSPRFSISSVHNVGVHLTDESGAEGFSYAYVFDPHSSNAVQELITLFADAYVGTEAADLRAVRTKLLTAKANFLGVRGLVRLATSALDMAAWICCASCAAPTCPASSAPSATSSRDSRSPGSGRACRRRTAPRSLLR